MNRSQFVFALATSFVSTPVYAQYCPSYSPSSSFNDYNCAIEAVAGTDPTTAQWNDIFDLVSRGPAVWGNAGPSVADIGQGCGLPETYHEVPARFPCELLKAIVQTESGWTQFCVPTTPSDQVGGPSRTIISFDCGYGASQVTSGMHIGESPNFDRNLVASDPTYNLATGTRILANKWRGTQCVGDNQPTIIEHWYISTWAYNGLAYVNNPNNPNYDPNRGVYNPQAGGSAPYQEKVFGRMEHTSGLWDSTPVAYPNPGDIGGGSSPPQLPEPSCASPTDCSSSRPTHATACQGEVGGAGGGGGAGGSDPSSVASSTASAGGGVTSGGGDTTSPSASSAGGSDGAFTGPSFREDEGCGCRFVGDSPRPRGLAWIALMALAFSRTVRGRRRGPRRRRSLRRPR